MEIIANNLNEFFIHKNIKDIISEFIFAKYLLGPVSMYELQNENGVKIYLFGDIHKKLNDCSDKNFITISELIKNTIVSNPDKIIDIFLEAEYLHKDKKNILDSYLECYLKDVIYDYKNCLQIDKKECEFPNARFHYVDVRCSLKKFCLYVNYFFEFINDIKEDKETSINYLNILKSVKISPNVIFDITFIMELISEAKIKKQLNKIEDNNIKNITCDYFISKLLQFKFTTYESEFVELLYMHCKTVEDIKKYISLYENKVLLEDLYEKIMSYNATLVNFYTSSRILGLYSKYNIIYLGGCHIKELVKFFTEQLKFNIVNFIDTIVCQDIYLYNSANQCLYIGNFNQPLFN